MNEPTRFPRPPDFAVRNLARNAPGSEGFPPVSLEAPSRRVLAVLRSGGASTLLRTIVGLDVATGGRVEVAGRDVTAAPPEARGIGMVLRGLALFEHLDAAENIRFGLRVARWPVADRELRVVELLRLVGLSQRGQARIESLAPGERLRVAVARALALEPTALLLDEPLEGIDEPQRSAERMALREILQRVQLAVVVGTSNVDDALALATDLALLGPEGVLQAGPAAEVMRHPASMEAALLLGYVILIEGRPQGERLTEPGVGSLDLPPSIETTGRIEVMVHPASVLAVPQGFNLGVGVSAIVTASRPQGVTSLLELALGERRRLLARWEWDAEAPATGSRVDLAVQPSALCYYTAALAGGSEEAALPLPELNAAVGAGVARAPRSVAATRDG